ncbi:MAG: cell division protein ZapA [Lachnospiraceae bacterium]|nr:cell division protein ZapA [Lachnospiraceae bacterium]
MAEKTNTEVLIGGKVFTLSGNESEDYLQRIAAYINGKYSEYSKVDSFRRQPVDMQNILMQLNIADDYFKARTQVEILQEEVDNKDRELYDVRHELVTAQIKLQSMEKTLRELQDENNENQKRIVKLETRLSSEGREEGKGKRNN